jgi:hypothetical protein
MSGGAVPYHLRPHKAVDRRLFLDLLSRYERWKPLSKFAYVSMGAYALEDHKMIHRIIGLTRLVAFDFDDAVVARQKFNRPIDSCRCIKKSSGDLIAELQSILTGFDFDDADGLVIWLDYTDPSELGKQIREFETLLSRLRVGDVVRITLNAHLSALGDSRGADGRPILASDLRAKRFQKLKDRIGDYLPSWATEELVTEGGLPRLLSGSLAASALKALPVGGANSFVPLSLVRYADGQQMLSVTGAVVASGDESALMERLHIETWPFASANWEKIHQLVVPVLTVRERLFLEREIISKTPKQLVQELGFETASDMKVEDFLVNYKDYYRFYPTLLSAEL